MPENRPENMPETASPAPGPAPTGQRPLCLFCRKELRPNYRNPEMPFAVYGNPQAKRAWSKANPKQFKGTYGGYGDNRFCSLTCGYGWAIRHAPRPAL
jgi:hypothetical protein